ncbi:hypothetical protein A6A29_40845 [Streptomyces sp. TSRI0281]|nr:hypothetical protein A6A29_40845 [Streptomyces sp. TSRI0281]
MLLSISIGCAMGAGGEVREEPIAGFMAEFAVGTCHKEERLVKEEQPVFTAQISLVHQGAQQVIGGGERQTHLAGQLFGGGSVLVRRDGFQQADIALSREVTVRTFHAMPGRGARPHSLFRVGRFRTGRTTRPTMTSAIVSRPRKLTITANSV